jgi:formylglycine-generating enzyme required for sulfatase activity
VMQSLFLTKRIVVGRCGVWLVAAGFIALVLMCSLSRDSLAETPNSTPGTVFRDCPDCPEMVIIPAGDFMMGSSPEEAQRDLAAAPKSDYSAREAVLQEQPQHKVTIARPFSLSKFPVTKSEFAAFVQETGYEPAPGCALFENLYRISAEATWRLPGFIQTGRDPVVCVNWQDAKAYIDWLNKKFTNSAKTGSDGPYRLPSEAEWEYAARAGTQTARWWGDPIGRNNAVCDGCGSDWDKKETAQVGSFHANPFGLYDVLGNVWQWTEDCWNENYVNAPTEGSPWTTGNCERRVGRGGDWANMPRVLRSATRSGLQSDLRTNLGGFRVAKTLQPLFP